MNQANSPIERMLGTRTKGGRIGSIDFVDRYFLVGPRADGWPLSRGAPLFPDGPEDKRHQSIVRRAIGRGESSDFTKFPLSETIIETSPDMPPPTITTGRRNGTSLIDQRLVELDEPVRWLAGRAQLLHQQGMVLSVVRHPVRAKVELRD